MEGPSGEFEIESTTLNTNNFWHWFADEKRGQFDDKERKYLEENGGWDVETEKKFNRMNTLFNEFDRIAKNIGANSKLAVTKMQKAIDLAHSGKVAESEALRQEAEQLFAPIFDVLVEAGHASDFLMG
jgi:hypothetical protein